MSREKRVCLGAFAGAHGVRGEIKVRTFTEAEENISAYGPLFDDKWRAFTIKVLRVLKPGFVLASAREVATREEAEALAGVRLYVAREALPPANEGEFYVEDLVGLAAFDENGAPLGRVAAMHNFGAGDIIELAGEKGSVFVPFTDEAAPSVDVAQGRIVIHRAFVAPPTPEEPENG